jgi:hypothetical protein
VPAAAEAPRSGRGGTEVGGGGTEVGGGGTEVGGGGTEVGGRTTKLTQKRFAPWAKHHQETPYFQRLVTPVRIPDRRR